MVSNIPGPWNIDTMVYTTITHSPRDSFYVYSYRNHNWFWVPFLGPHVGAVVGAIVYQILVGLHFPDDDDDDDDDAASGHNKNKPIDLEEKIMLHTNSNDDEMTVGNCRTRKYQSNGKSSREPTLL